MKTDVVNIQTLIEGLQQYIVPLFQRSYSWEQKQWDRLWDDLKEIADSEDYPTHFIGSIVTLQNPSTPGRIPTHLLIDGQQRLTTLFILLILLRDLLYQQGTDELAEDIQDLITNRRRKNDEYYKLMPTQWDRSAFQSLINREPFDDNGQIIKCYKFFKKQIIREANTLNLHKLKTVIDNQLQMVVITLDQNENAYLVFESLNNTAMDLSQADLIRNYLIMLIDEDETTKKIIYDKYWVPMQEALGNDLTDFFRHFLMKWGGNVNKREVYHILRTKLNLSSSNVITGLQELGKFAKYYKRFISPETEIDRQVQGYLSRLKRLKQTTCYPFLLNCYGDYEDGKLSRVEFIEILAIIENFLIRHQVCERKTNELKSLFASLYNDIGNSTNFVKSLKDSLQKRNKYPNDAQFRDALINSEFYGTKQERNDLTKIIFERLEIQMSLKEKLSFENLTIEHIMPRSLTDWWRTHLGDEAESIHHEYIHRLGNLTLTGYNSELSNKPFYEKKEIFTSSKISLNGYFSNTNTWNAKEILLRTQYLADQILKIWFFFGDLQSNTIDFQGDFTGKKPYHITFLGKRYPTNTWKDVMEQTFNVIAEFDPDGFRHFAKSSSYIKPDRNHHFISPRQLFNGYYIETNHSANQVYKKCEQALRAIDLNSEDWSVDTD